MRRVGVCSWRESLKLVGQLARNHRAAVGQLDGSKQVAAVVGARAGSHPGPSHAPGHHASARTLSAHSWFPSRAGNVRSDGDAHRRQGEKNVDARAGAGVSRAGASPLMIETVLRANGFPEAAEWIDQPHIHKELKSIADRARKQAIGAEPAD